MNNKETKRIIVWCNLSSDFFMNNKKKYSEISHVTDLWKSEIRRLLWKSANSDWSWNHICRWPLITFLQWINEANYHWIKSDFYNIWTSENLIRDFYSDIGLKNLVQPGKIINSEPYSDVFKQLQEWIADNGDPENTRIFLLWAPTEWIILDLCTFFNKQLLFNVWLSPYLVWSFNYDAHWNTLQQSLLDRWTEVLTDLDKVKDFLGYKIHLLDVAWFSWCKISYDKQLEEAMDKSTYHNNKEQRLSDDDKKSVKEIIRRLCMKYTQANLSLITWWYSWSLTLFADCKIWTVSKKVVFKIDSFERIRKEIANHRIAHTYLLWHAPEVLMSVKYSWGSKSYMWMEIALAAIEWDPITLLNFYNNKINSKENDPQYGVFCKVLKKTLNILTTKLYQPSMTDEFEDDIYKIFKLRDESVSDENRMNGILFSNLKKLFSDQFVQSGEGLELIDDKNLLDIWWWVQLQNFWDDFDKMINSKDPVRIKRSHCLIHRDLNLSNIIFDDNFNIQFIDWLSLKEQLMESDFARIENDIKFYLFSDYCDDDLNKLKQFEEYIINNAFLWDIANCPLEFVRDDIRFNRMYTLVSIIREKLIKMWWENLYKKNYSESFAIYKIALLRCAINYLKFDTKSVQGVGSLSASVQNKHALISISTLVPDIAQSSLYKRSKSSAPLNYPKRVSIPKNKKSWEVEFPWYKPKQYTDRLSCKKEFNHDPDRMNNNIRDRINNCSRKKVTFDQLWKPLNPFWRTWIEWKWKFYFWWPNVAADPILSRVQDWKFQVFLWKRKDTTELALPCGFTINHKTILKALQYAFNDKTWYDLSLQDITNAKVIHNDEIEDYRNTDNAWVHSTAFSIHNPNSITDITPMPKNENYTEAKWITVTSDVLSNLFSKHAQLIHEAIKELIKNWTVNKQDIDNSIYN